jgi:threonyl-tRNA synthetase
VVGRREAEQGLVALRRLGSQAQDVLGLADAVAMLREEATAPDLRRRARLGDQCLPPQTPRL